MRRRAFAILLLGFIAAYPAMMRTAKRSQTQRTPPRTPATTDRKQAPATGERAIAQQWLRSLTLRERIAQLVVVTSYGEAPSSRSAAYRDFVRYVRDLKVGGMIVVNRVVGGSVRNAEPYAMATFLNRMQRLAKIPLIVGADFERGASMRVSGTPKYPHQMAYGAANDAALTRAFGLATAREARALGVQWVFAPVADVNNNPDNPIINIRSFGESPTDVAKHVRAFIEGAHSDPANRVLVTVKHFPGHGDTATDSHIGMATLTANRERMQNTELVPFRESIAANVDAVMTAHMAVPAYESEEIPATVSKNILTGLLRDELKFSGLVVTDAMDMQGLAKEMSNGEAAVRALEAGADVLLMPPSPEAAIKAVYAAVNEGRLSSKRIDESVLRLLTAKARVGLKKSKLVQLDDISDATESVDTAEHAQLVADRAVTLVKNEGGVAPIRNIAATCTWVLTENRYGQQGRRFAEEMRTRAPGIRLQHLDPLVSLEEMEEFLQPNCETHVVAAFVSVAAYRGNVTLGGNYPALLEKLQGTGKPVLLVSLGSPYLLRNFPWVNSYMATFSPAPTAETAAAKAILGAIDVTGRLPVTIPGIAKYGEAIALSKIH